MRTRRRGSVAIEAALCLPFLIVTFLGVAELSRYISMHHQVARAARDGARVGSITIEGPDATGDEIKEAAVEQAQNVLDANGLGCSDGCDVQADWEYAEGSYWVTVTVTAPYVPLTSFFPTLKTGVVAHFTMMTQQQ